MNEKVIAENLVKLRQSHNWTQEDLSDKLHISRQAISKWETGSSMPNLETLLELSKLYSITINEILEPPLCEQITCFEDIINLDSLIVKIVLSQMNMKEIVKASMGASPQINELVRNLFNNIDFNKERVSIGSVRITEVEDIHRRIVDKINFQLKKAL